MRPCTRNERIVREKSAAVRPFTQKITSEPVGTPRGSVAVMDGLYIFKCCADFLNILSLFRCEFTALLLPAVPFVNRTIPGRGIKPSGKKKARNRCLDCEFTSFGMFGVSDGANTHINKFLPRLDGCDHTSTNAPDPIRTPQLSVLGRE